MRLEEVYFDGKTEMNSRVALFLLSIVNDNVADVSEPFFVCF